MLHNILLAYLEAQFSTMPNYNPKNVYVYKYTYIHIL